MGYDYSMKLTINLRDYAYECGDGCCYNYGTITTVNGVELEIHNEDRETILEQVLKHLGYQVEVVNEFENDEIDE